jgi:hypothetical protein
MVIDNIITRKGQSENVQIVNQTEVEFGWVEISVVSNKSFGPEM